MRKSFSYATVCKSGMGIFISLHFIGYMRDGRINREYSIHQDLAFLLPSPETLRTVIKQRLL